MLKNQLKYSGTDVQSLHLSSIIDKSTRSLKITIQDW